MISYRHSTTAPHILVRASGSVSGAEVRQELAPLREHLESMEPGFTVLAVYPELVMLKPDAVGALFYYIARLFDAEPKHFIMVDGGQSPHPGLRAFVQQLGVEGQLQFIETLEKAEAFIRASEASKENRA